MSRQRHHARKLAAANHADYWKSHIFQPTEKERSCRLSWL